MMIHKIIVTAINTWEGKWINRANSMQRNMENELAFNLVGMRMIVELQLSSNIFYPF